MSRRVHVCAQLLYLIVDNDTDEVVLITTDHTAATAAVFEHQPGRDAEPPGGQRPGWLEYWFDSNREWPY